MLIVIVIVGRIGWLTLFNTPPSTCLEKQSLNLIWYLLHSTPQNMWQDIARLQDLKCYSYHFGFVDLCVWCEFFYCYWHCLYVNVIVIILDLCLSLCVCLVGVRFLRKCSNLLYSNPIQALNWIWRLYYQSLRRLYTKVKHTSELFFLKFNYFF